jgi:PST family polysaccharide transporter
MIANVIATVAGIAVAALGGGVWALVVQTVLGSAFTSLVLVLQSGYRPRLYASWARFKPMFEMSRNFLGSQLMAFLNGRTDDFLIGSVLGSTALGVYAVGYRIVTVMNEVLSSSTRAVAFPIFSRLQHDRGRLLHAYRSAMRMCAVLAVPCYLFVLVGAHDLVLLLFGEQWRRSVPVMQILCLFGVQQAVLQFNASLLNALGRARQVLRINVAGTVLQVVAFAVTVHFGLVWVAAAYVGRAYVIAPVGLWLAARALDTTVRETLGGLVPPALSSAAMVLVMVAVDHGLSSVPAMVRLFAMAVTGFAAYLVVLRATGPRHLAEAMGYAKAVLARRRTTLGAAA